MFPKVSRLRVVAGTLALLAFLTAFPLQAAVGPTNEFRGIWVDAWGNGFLNASQVTKLVSDCRTYNFNAVVVQMRRRGDAYYMPQAPNGEPRSTALSANYDALQEIINQCHNTNGGLKRIEVHCWTPTHLIWSDANNAPANAGHVYNLHPEYLMENSTGQKNISEGFYLDPGHPGATLWNYNMAKDVVSRYDVDGFHWDYIRYPQQDSGFNPTAVARYNAEFGLTGKPSPSSAQFSTWRRRQVTDFLRWANSDLIGIKSNLVISCSVFSSRSDAFNARFQDWAAWNKEGIIDICMPMDYSSNNDGVFNPRADDAFANQFIRRVYVGPGAYLNTKENTVTQLNYVRNKGFLGSTLYSYRTPNGPQPAIPVDQAGTFAHVRDNYQPTWLNVPSIPWKVAPTNGLLKGGVLRSDNLAGIYNAPVIVSGPTLRTNIAEAHGKYAFFELAPGSYSVSVTPPGLGTIATNITIAAGQILDLNLVVSVVDTTDPVFLSGPVATNITFNQATIVWTTDEPADSYVYWGEDDFLENEDSSDFLTTSHSLTLSNLASDTTYYFAASSMDAAGNYTDSTMFTFKTTPSNVVSDLIIDNLNANATSVGTWSPGTSSADKFATDYRFRSKGTGASYFEYTPNILVAGDYRVYEWHPAGGNRASDVPYIVKHANGIATNFVNQTINGGRWNELGIYTFATGNAGRVRITDGFTSAGVVMADAVKLEFVVPPPLAPTQLKVLAVATNEITVGWTDNATNELEYVLSRSRSSLGPFEDLVVLPPDSTNYTDLNLAESTRYYYVVRAFNAAGFSLFSNQTNAVTLAGPPIIDVQPVGQIVPEGSDINLSVGVRAFHPYFQWYFNGVALAGQTGSSLSLTNVTVANDGEYKVTVSNTTALVESDTVLVRVNYSIFTTTTVGGTIQLSPDQTSYAFNDNVTVTAVPDPGGVFIGWTGDLSGTNPVQTLIMTRSYHITAHFMPNSAVIVDDTDPQATLYGAWTFGVGTLDKYADSYYYINSTPGTATAEGYYAPNIIYPGKYNVSAWYPAANTRSANVPVFISYADGDVFTSLNQTTNGGKWVPIASLKQFEIGTNGYVQISNATGESGKIVAADAFRFELINPPLIIVPPQSLVVSEGSPASFSVLASGTTNYYQWKFNGTNLAGATGTSYSIPSARTNHAGIYQVAISNQLAVLISDPAFLAVNTTPPSFGGMAKIPGGGFQLSFSAGFGTFALETSTNLTVWNVLTNFSSTNSTIQFMDDAATNFSSRFYRLRQVP